MTTQVKERTPVHPKLEQWATDLYYYDKYGDPSPAPEPGDTIYMGNLKQTDKCHGPDDGPLFIMPSIFTSGDYVGDIVNLANYTWLVDNWCSGDENSEPVTLHVHPVYGGYGSTSIAINVTDIEDSAAEELAEILDALDDYPLIDDEVMSELELEAQNDAWENWAAWDFARHLSDLSGLDIERDETFDGPLYALLWTEAERQNEYWQTEGIDAWIDLERVVPSVPRHSVHWLALVQQSNNTLAEKFAELAKTTRMQCK